MAGQIKNLEAKVVNGVYELKWYVGKNTTLWNNILERIKMIPGRMPDKDAKGKFIWKVPINSRTTELLTEIGFRIKEEKVVEVKREKVVAIPPTKWKDEVIRDMTDKARNYQVDGVKMIQAFNYNCLLADQAGSGKTLMTLSAVRTSEIRPILIVCPSSLKLNWKKEAKMWLNPDDKDTLYVIQGKTVTEDYSKYSHVVINYDVLIHHVPFITKHFKPKMLIGDEIHEGKSIPKIVSKYYPDYPLKKNEQVLLMNNKKVIATKQSKRVQALNCIISGFTHEDEELAGYKWEGTKHNILLSATPLPNHAGDMWNILHWLDPKRFKNLDKYLDYFCHQEEGFKQGIPVIKRSKNLDILNKLLVENYMIRRLKSEILPELPPRNKAVVPLMMEDHWWKEYKKADEDFVTWIRENKKKNIITDEQERSARFTTLQEIALKGKLKESFQFIDNLLLTKDKKIVVFMHHKETVNKVMEKYGKKAVRLVGGMSNDEKELSKELFQTDKKIRLIVCNIKTGSVGHTLTASDTVVFIETHYSAHLIDQAFDRVHRIGQESKSVMAYFLQAAGSIEKLILAKLDRKTQEMDKAIDGVETEEANMLEYLWSEYEKRA